MYLNTNEPITYKYILEYSIYYLKNNAVEYPFINAEALIQHCLNINKFDTILYPNKIITDISKIKELILLLDERIAGKPLQYLIGKIYFNNIELEINENVLIPRPETEELVSIIIKDIRDLLIHKSQTKCYLNILDMCTGSGCIALSLCQHLKAINYQSKYYILGIDISKNAIKIANQNKKKLKLNNIEFKTISIEKFLEKTKKNTQITYDLIICNPPYISKNDFSNLQKELYYEPSIALTDGRDGFYFYKIIKNNLNSLLKTKGQRLYFECGIEQASVVSKMYKNMKYNATIIRDFSNIDRFLIVDV